MLRCSPPSINRFYSINFFAIFLVLIQSAFSDPFSLLQTESFRAYGRGIAFYVGEPCPSGKCNDILFHVFCNQSSHRCECLSSHPVNIEDSVCAPALSLGQRCEYDESCKFVDLYSECSKEEQRCRCMNNYMPKVNLTHGTSCIQSKGIYTLPDYHDLLTLLIIVLLSFLLIILTFIAYKLCINKKNSTLNLHSIGAKSKLTDNQFDQREAVSPFVLLDDQQQQQQHQIKRDSSNVSSDSNISKTILDLQVPQPPFRNNRSVSYSMLAPCSTSMSNKFLQRRPSLSSIQSSFRSYSSFRSNSPCRNYFKQMFTNFKRSNVRSIQDNLCESFLVRPESFTTVDNGQQRLMKTNRTDNKLSENLKRQHLLNNYLHHHHLNSNLHHHHHHHSNHQLNQLNQTNHLHHHYDKEFLRPAVMQCTPMQTHAPQTSTSYLGSRTGLSNNISNVRTSSTTNQVKTNVQNNVLKNASTNTNNLNNLVLNSTSMGGSGNSCVLNNNNLLKKGTKIEERSSN